MTTAQPWPDPAPRGVGSVPAVTGPASVAALLAIDPLRVPEDLETEYLRALRHGEALPVPGLARTRQSTATWTTGATGRSGPPRSATLQALCRWHHNAKTAGLIRCEFDAATVRTFWFTDTGNRIGVSVPPALPVAQPPPQPHQTVTEEVEDHAVTPSPADPDPEREPVARPSSRPGDDPPPF